MMIRSLYRVLVLMALAGCELPAAAPPARLWTLFDLARAFDESAIVAAGADGLPEGIPAANYLAARGPTGPTLRISPAVSEKAGAAYVTTEVWSNVPAVWIQPMYILVTAWNADDPLSNYLEGAPWIYTVGPGSAFYSPFWRVYWAVVPPDTDPLKYTSSRQLLDDHVELHEGSGRLVALVPDGTALEPAAQSLPGRIGREPALGAPQVRTADRLDGQSTPVSALDFGANRFSWNEKLEVVAQPLFVLQARQPDGSWARAGAPNVGGTRSLFTQQAPIAPKNRPYFGSLWRLHTVHLPANDNAGLFLPKALDAARTEVAAGLHGLALPAIDWEPDAAEVDLVNAHALQVALNAKTCFATREAFDTCRWLDSQAAIEAALPAGIAPTGILATCPFVSYGGAMVPVQ